MKHQLQWVKEQLETRGYVTRNEALAGYCSRLGALINKLKKEGYVISGHYEKTERGKDYKYELIIKPQ